MATHTIARPVKRPATKTPPFRGPDGEVVPGSIAEIAYLRLGGVDQWVMIRGESVANPPLILLHGGPGSARRASSVTSTRRWRRASRSSTGISAAPASRSTADIPRSSMTVEQFISDLDELVDAVCKRLGKTKVVIFGHSWGSALGVLYAARFPEKVAAYVGSGQIGDWRGGRGGLVRVRARRSAAPRQPQGAEEAARDRPAAPHRRAAVDGAHLGDAPRGRHEPEGAVEGGASRSRRPGVLDLRSAQHHARLPVLARRDVGGGLAAESPRARARTADARVLLPRAQGPLGPARDQRGLLRRADRALEEARLVRAVRTRAVRGRAGQVQRRDGGAGPAGSTQRPVAGAA